MRNRCRGFTLVEALCAGVVLALGATMISTGVSHALASATAARDKRHAAMLLDEVLTRIDVIGPQRLSTQGPTEGRIADRFHWRAEIDKVDLGGLYEVEAVVEWDTPRGPRSVSAQTRIHDPAGTRRLNLQWESHQ